MLVSRSQQLAAATRERNVLPAWWLGLSLVLGGILIWKFAAAMGTSMIVFAAIVLAGVAFAPWAARRSLTMPRRAAEPAPAPGEGTYDQWRRQCKWIGSFLIYELDNPNLSPEGRAAMRAACGEMRGVLKAHPLSDDLERLCLQMRRDGVEKGKEDLWQAMQPGIQECRNWMEEQMAEVDSIDQRMEFLREVIGGTVATLSRIVLPRLLEEERVLCMTDCVWLATYALHSVDTTAMPVELSAALVLEWSDLSQPWTPASALDRALERLNQPAAVFPSSLAPVAATAPAAAAPRTIPPESSSPPPPAPVAPAPAAEPDAAADSTGNGEHITIINGKRYRRVRVRKYKRSHRRKKSHVMLMDARSILLSFGQWIRYSVRSWWMNH